MRRRIIFIGFAVLLMVIPACKSLTPGDIIADEAIKLEKTREAQEGEEDQEPTATPTKEAGDYPKTIKDPEDDFRVECDGEPSPGAGPAWADVVEVTRVSANEFLVTFRGDPQAVTEMIKEGNGGDVPESFGLSLIVETPEDEYIEYGVDWYSYYPAGERKEVHESAPDPAFKALFNALFEWEGPNTLRIILEPEARNVLSPQTQFRVHVGVDLAGAEPQWACDQAPARN